MVATVEELVPALTRGELVRVHVEGRKRTVVNVQKPRRKPWTVEFTSGAAMTVPAGYAFHRVAR